LASFTAAGVTGSSCPRRRRSSAGRRPGRVVGDGDFVELDEAAGAAGSQLRARRDEPVHVACFEVGVESGGVAVDLVKVEASWRVAGFVGGEGDAARLLADCADQFGDLVAEI